MLASCQDENSVPVTEASFEINVSSEENTIAMTVVPSEAEAVYVAGIIMEDDYVGEDGLTAWIESAVAEGADLRSGNWSERYSDLFWHTKYYAYAAQINDGKVVGCPGAAYLQALRGLRTRGSAHRALCSIGQRPVGCRQLR